MAEQTSHSKQLLIKRIALALGLLCSLGMVLRLLTADMLPLTIYLGFLVIGIYFAIFLLPLSTRNSSLSVCALTGTNYFGLFTIIYFASGLSAPVTMLIPALCVVGFLTLSNRSSLLLCIFTILGVFALAYLELIGHSFPVNPLDSRGELIMRAVWLVFATIAVALTVYYSRQENKLLENQLYEISITDHLTGLYNRRYFDQFIAEEYSRNKRGQSWLAIVLIDIDHFKMYNDTYGHQAGDDCLQAIAKLLKSHFKRSVDRIIRYGGEEFIVALPETELEQAFHLAEEFREQVKGLNIIHSISNHKTITVSIGVNAVHGSYECNLQALIRGADQAMYQSKQQGKNRTTVFSDHEPAQAKSE